MSNLLTIDDCDTVVKKYLNTQDVKTIDFKLVYVQNQNFLLKVTISHNDKEKTLQFFAKPVLTSPKIEEILYDFKRIIPNFDSKFTPKLYHGKSDLLLFEDLSLQGFENCNSRDLLDLEHLKVVLKLLAKFHAGSFTYEEIKSKQMQIVYRLNHEYKLGSCNFVLTQSEPTSSLLEDTDLSMIVKNLDQLSSMKFRRTLCHGHLTSDNIMFKYEKGTPVECKLINFKSRLYAPPIVDVLRLIFFNSDAYLRQQNYRYLLSYYYDCLDEELQTFHVKIDDIVGAQEWQLQTDQLQTLIKLEAHRLQYVSVKELKQDLNYLLLSREDCYAILANKLKTTDYDFESFKLAPLDSVSGFLGSYHRLQIEVRHESTLKTVDLFIKCVPKVRASSDVVNDSNGFTKEAFVFNTIIPKFEEFGIKMISDCLPMCYLQRADAFMVLEDMTALNYKTTPAVEPYDFDTLCLIIKKVAKFHAAAFIYEEKMSERLKRKYRLNEEYAEYFKEAIIVDDENHAGGRLMENGVRSILFAAELFPELQTEENSKNLSRFFPELRRLFYSTLVASGRFRNVLTHGDLWSSNILLKHEDEKVVDCKFVDYQLLRYCPPGHDFLAVLHLTTIRDIRLKHEEELKRVYYDELTHLVESFGYDVATILPYEDFLGGIDLMRPEMVLQAAIYGEFSMCTAEQISSMLGDETESNRVFFEDRRDFVAKMCKISPVYKSRLRDRVQDVYDYCNFLAK